MDLKEEIISTISQPTSGIANPVFDLKEGPYGEVTGFVISNSFTSQPQLDRQNLVWSVLEKSVPKDHLSKVIMLLTVTPAENSTE